MKFKAKLLQAALDTQVSEDVQSLTKQVDELVHFVSQHLAMLKSKLNLRYGESYVEEELTKSGILTPLVSLYSPLVFQRIQGTLSNPNLRIYLLKLLASGPAKKLLKEQP